MKKTLLWMVTLSAFFFFVGREEGYVQGVLDAAVEHILNDSHATSCVPQPFDSPLRQTGSPASLTSL
jgi:hypothetical protein